MALITSRARRTLWTIAILLTVIGIAAVLRRSLVLSGLISSPANPRTENMDSGFTRHRILTFVHIGAGALFLITGLLIFRKKQGNVRFQESLDRVFVLAGYVMGISALIMSFTLQIGGAPETAATAFYGVFFLFALTRRVFYKRDNKPVLQREWQIRAFSIALAIATIRVIAGLFFALSSLPPREFFGAAFWLGFTIHLIGAEAWINYTSNR